MDLWVIRRERRDDLEAWKDWVPFTFRRPQRPSTVKFIIEVVSILFITGGIVGELWAGVRITSINGVLRVKSAELRSKSDLLLALVTNETSKANERAAGLENEAETERLARVKLEAQVAPRKISENKMPTLVKCLGKLKGERFSLVSQGGAEPEITDFAKQLESALKAAGLNFPGLTPINMPGAIGNPGLTVMAGKDRTADASLLTRCLVQAGVPRSEIKRETAEPSQLGLSVGYKRR
jgi:hypothetical protein